MQNATVYLRPSKFAPDVLSALRFRDARDDVILWLLRRIVDAAPGLPSNDVIELEQQARITWGGRRVYIARQGCGLVHRVETKRDRSR